MAESPASELMKQSTRWIEFVRILLYRLRTINHLSGDAGTFLGCYVIDIIRDFKPYSQRGEIAVEYWSGEPVTICTNKHLPSDEVQRLRDSIEHLLTSGGEAIVQLTGAKLRLRHFDTSATARRAEQTIARVTQPAPNESVSDFSIEGVKSFLDSKLSDVPLEFNTRRIACRTLHSMIRSAVVIAFEPVLNEMAQSLPQATYEEKKALAKWVNAEIRELGLAIRCPKTGLPGILRGHAGGIPGVGRFHVEVTDAQGVQRRTVTSTTLPKLDLMPDDLARAPYGERTHRSR